MLYVPTYTTSKKEYKKGDKVHVFVMGEMDSPTIKVYKGDINKAFFNLMKEISVEDLSVEEMNVEIYNGLYDYVPESKWNKLKKLEAKISNKYGTNWDGLNQEVIFNMLLEKFEFDLIQFSLLGRELSYGYETVNVIIV